jgi:hypothetical protein
MCFVEKWCEQCIRFPISPDAKTQCAHFLRSLIEDHNGKWFYDDSGLPECIAFRSREEAYKNRKRSAKKDKNQLSLFAL